MQLAINDRLRLHHHRPYGVQSSAVISMISKKPRNSRTRGRGGGGIEHQLTHRIPIIQLSIPPLPILLILKPPDSRPTPTSSSRSRRGQIIHLNVLTMTISTSSLSSPPPPSPSAATTTNQKSNNHTPEPSQQPHSTHKGPPGRIPTYMRVGVREPRNRHEDQRSRGRQPQTPQGIGLLGGADGAVRQGRKHYKQCIGVSNHHPSWSTFYQGGKGDWSFAPEHKMHACPVM